MKKNTVLVSALLIAGLSLAGCTSVSGAKGPDSDTKPPMSQSAEGPSEVPTTEAPAALHLGDTFTWDDGMSMSVTLVQEFQPTEYAAGGGQAHNIILSFTITNNTTENFDPLALTKIVSGGVAGAQVFDTGNTEVQISDFAPTAAILPGNSITWTEAWSVTDLATLQVQTSPAPFTYDDAIFTP